MKLYKDAAGVLVGVDASGNSFTKLHPDLSGWARAHNELVRDAINSGQLRLIGNNYKALNIIDRRRQK